MLKIQQGRAIDLKEIEKHTCRKLLKAYEIVEDEDEDKGLIESAEDDDVLTTHISKMIVNGRLTILKTKTFT